MASWGVKGNSEWLWKSVENLVDLHAAEMVQWERDVSR